MKDGRSVDWRRLTAAAAELIRQGQAPRALQQLEAAERAAPREREVRYWLGNACRMTGQAGRARRIFRGLLAERPDDLETSFALAFLLRDTGAPGDAAEVLLQASRQPGMARAQLLQIAGFLRDGNQVDGAIEVCENAAALGAPQADLEFKLARLYQARGDFEQARAKLRLTLELEPATGPAWIALAQQHRFESADDETFRSIEAAAARSLGREADMCVAFAHGKALDDLGRWPEAWARFGLGNRLMAEKLPWNGRAWADFVDRALARDATPAAPAAGRDAVFIVGMPRSGTTLLEQMLDRHPEIHGRGELNFLSHFAEQRSAGGAPDAAQRRALGDALWTQLKLHGPQTGAYVDKNPLNFRYLDLLFEILPNARVLHLVRDGRASGLSCWFQLFEHPDMAFSYDLDGLVQFYSGYRRLMAHWERRYPERIRRVPYDDLVRAPAEVLAGVLEFLGREWNEAVLEAGGRPGLVRSASAWQARQPVHAQSVERWRNYRDQAPEFFERLAAVEERFR